MTYISAVAEWPDEVIIFLKLSVESVTPNHLYSSEVGMGAYLGEYNLCIRTSVQGCPLAATLNFGSCSHLVGIDSSLVNNHLLVPYLNPLQLLLQESCSAL